MDVGRSVVGSPALAEDVIALAIGDRQTALLDRPTGDVIWRRRLGGPLGTGPLLDLDRVIVATQAPDGRLYALSLRSGRRLWRVRMGDVVAPLALDDSVVYAGTADGQVAAFSALDGARRWRTSLAGAVRAAPLLTSAGLVVATTSDSIFILHRGTGAVRARAATRGTVQGAVTLARGRPGGAPADEGTDGAGDARGVGTELVIVGTAAGWLEAVEPATLAARWRLNLHGPVVGAVAVQADTAFALTDRGTLWAVPLADPGSARSVALRVISRAGPTPVAGAVIVGTVGGEILMADRETGERRWSARLEAPITEPVLVEGKLLLAVSARGEVVAFR